LNVQLTLDEKLLGKIKNAIRTGGKIQRQQAVYTRHTTHTGERLFGRYLPAAEEETIGAVTGGIEKVFRPTHV
jgi:hypothetical protein